MYYNINLPHCIEIWFELPQVFQLTYIKIYLNLSNNIQGEDTDTHHWKNGLRFYQHLLNIKLKGHGRGRSKRAESNFSKIGKWTHNSVLSRGRRRNSSNEFIATNRNNHDNDMQRIFNGNGYLRDAELKIMNFKPSGCKSNSVKGKCWEEVCLLDN